MSIFLEITWHALPESKEVDIDHLSKDVEGLIRLVDLMGAFMKPVRNDISGNVKKILDSRVKNGPEKQFLHDLIEIEIERGINKKDPSACVGLLWLKRGVEYFFEFIKLLCEELEAGTLADNLVEISKRAYERTLKEHHNWFMNKTFTMVAHLTPKRATCEKNFTQNRPELLENLPRDMRLFVDSVGPVLSQLNELISKYEIDKK